MFTILTHIAAFVGGLIVAGLPLVAKIKADAAAVEAKVSAAVAAAKADIAAVKAKI